MSLEVNENSKLPLDGVKVIDMTIAMAGPLATQRLADLGADVIKVESPNGGDLTRVFRLNDLMLGEDTSSYLSLNRNKRSIVVNLKSDKGLEVIYKMVENAAVFIQNFRPGVAEKLGIDYDKIKGINPKIVYASITGYGSSGPMVGAPGQDLLAQSISGLTYSGGKKSEGPHPSPCYMADTSSSHLVTSGILAGLYQTKMTGEGTYVETSLLGSLLEMQTQEVMTYFGSGKAARRCDAPFASAWLDPPYGIYKMNDGWIAFAQGDLNVIADALKLVELRNVNSEKPAPSMEPETDRWREDCYNVLANWLLDLTVDKTVQLLSKSKVWCMRVNTFEEAMAHPQLDQFFSTMDRPDHGTIKCVAPALKVGNSGPEQTLRPAPKLNEHRDEVLSELGYSEVQIKNLIDDKALT